jgi:hypothetical protein
MDVGIPAMACGALESRARLGVYWSFAWPKRVLGLQALGAESG